MEGDGRKTKTVCVTGAGGFVASWLVQRLLSSGDYTVHGTVRDPSDPKNGHLKALVGAEERLRLFKADVLDYASVASAVAGCDGVFHVASPVPAAKSQNPEVDVLAPAVKGTQNVLNACHEAKVRRVVVVSSAAAVIMNPPPPPPPPPRTPSWTKTRGQTRTTAETRRFGTASPRRSPSARLWRTRRRQAWTSSRSARPWFSALCCNPWRTPAAWSSSTCSKATVKPSSMTRRGTWWTSVTSPTLSSWCTRTRRRPGGTSAARTGRGCLKWWKSPGASVQI